SGGPGGYETAIRLHQFGIETTVFEKERLGGVCLNWGCIPTKTLVKVADLYHEIKNAKD
ncbi:MAG TPA: dihydrolipoyl dehydrogenase, partial [Candidatus Cloacimonas sp.]|nr:dihydrolipoyl dehydrogenase [Candidatus Cloacimonas sp.]